MGPRRALLLPGPRKQPSMEEQQRGHKKKKEFWPRVGTERERQRIEGVD